MTVVSADVGVECLDLLIEQRIPSLSDLVDLELIATVDVDAWIDEHRDELAWAHPEWR